MVFWLSVFRELLQNSNDAQSKAIEIHFEMKEFVDKVNAAIGSDDVGGEGDVEQVLPDLSSALVMWMSICCPRIV
jgi:hypothetical protein